MGKIIDGIKLFFNFSVAVIVAIMWACTGYKTKTDVADYMYIYEMFDDWTIQTDPRGRTDIFGYGEYLYNSYMVLFPRRTPSTLTEFYYDWKMGMDCDSYAVYFTCQMDEADYAGFVQGLEAFCLQSSDAQYAPLYDTEHFDYPTYILQWVKPDEKWEVLEYVMLDDENRTAVFVYTMSLLEGIEENSAYDVMPNVPITQVVDEDFSIYDDYENCTYDIAFLEYLM